MPQYTITVLDRSFTYVYSGDKKVDSGYRVLIKFNNKQIAGYVVSAEKSDLTREELIKKSGYDIEEIIDVIDTEPILNQDLLALVDEMTDYYLCGKMAILQCMLPPSLNIRKSTLKAPKIAYESLLEINGEFNTEGLTAAQKEIYVYINDHAPVIKREIHSQSIISKLLASGKIKEVKVEKRRLNVEPEEKEKIDHLTPDQERVINEFNSSSDSVFLLEGVTGSGKTEVYLTICEQYLKMGKSILMLVPEIALTKAMSDYFISRFHSDVAILHSNLTPAERYDEYRRIQRGEAKIVVGARSAIFAPLSNIGLIILDEEHTESYKQDVYPFYHARDIALMRAKMHGAKVILGSATPSLESRSRASKGIYHLLTLDKRINEMPLPSVTVVDISKRYNMSDESYLFSRRLVSEMRDRLAKKEQIILLVNKRGFSTMMCRECGKPILCPTCKVPLVYHKKDDTLKCHHCGFIEDACTACPHCGSDKLMKLGYGTEKIEEEIGKVFPEAKILRLDSDSAKGRSAIREIIDDFSHGKADILIGTQMIAKGHDFKNVTLVGALNADIGLNNPSYKSSERTFQLLTQAIGRCGRGEKEGEAIIQTYNPSHYAITNAARQDYENFYKIEMKSRKTLKNPPYYYLCAIRLSCKSARLVVELSLNVKDSLTKILKDDAIIYGPITPYISYSDGKYNRTILLKYRDVEKIKTALKNIKDLLSHHGSIDIGMDFDPYDF
ncbi:MAG: primosomal protein N' [Coprobacillus sp.]|nr:primosomal protein N' [Coprobacillus sp.]